MINQSLTSVAVSDPVLVGRQAQEGRYIDEVCQIAGRVFLVPWMAAPLEAAKLEMLKNDRQVLCSRQTRSSE